MEFLGGGLVKLMSNFKSGALRTATSITRTGFELKIH